MPGTLTPRRHSGKSGSERLAEGEQMLADRVMGMRYSDLMEKYSVSKATLERRLRAALDARLSVTVDAYREQQNALLDELMSRHEEGLKAADLLMRWAVEREDPDLVASSLQARVRSLEAMLRVAERRARLNGTDAPVKADVTVTEVTPQERELAALLDQAERDVKAREAAIVEGEVV